MKVIYSGNYDELTPSQKKTIEAKFAKLGKLLDRIEEKEVHAVLSVERHVRTAEFTINYYDHPVIGAGSAADLFTALASAIEKAEKQILKLRARWRDTKRSPKAALKVQAVASAPASVEPDAGETGRRVFRVNHYANRKPMTLDEAMLEMDEGRDYMVYRDAERDGISVLVRRRDGHFDLIEA